MKIRSGIDGEAKLKRGVPLHAAEGVVVDEVGTEAGEAVGVVELDADVVVDGEDGGVGGDEEIAGPLRLRKRMERLSK